MSPDIISGAGFLTRHKAVITSFLSDPLGSSIFATIWSVLASMFALTPQYLISWLLAVAIDFRTGVKKARTEGREIRSYGFRQTTSKVVDGGLLLILASVVANVGDLSDLPSVLKSVTTVVDDAAWAWLVYIEFKSIVENTGYTDFKEFFKRFFAQQAKILDSIDKKKEDDSTDR